MEANRRVIIDTMLSAVPEIYGRSGDAQGLMLKSPTRDTTHRGNVSMEWDSILLN
jgi:hypothetical protein